MQSNIHPFISSESTEKSQITSSPVAFLIEVQINRVGDHHAGASELSLSMLMLTDAMEKDTGRALLPLRCIHQRLCNRVMKRVQNRLAQAH